MNNGSLTRMKIDLLSSDGGYTWGLLPGQAKRLYSLLCVLPGTKLPIQSSVGYHGIRVFLNPSEMMVVYNGRVEITSDVEVRRFLDHGRELESWLFSTGWDYIEKTTYGRLLMSEFQKDENT